MFWPRNAKILLIPLFLVFALASCRQDEEGGIIGGGSMHYAELLNCKAESPDRSSPVTQILLLAEADLAGRPIPGAPILLSLRWDYDLIERPTNSRVGDSNFDRVEILDGPSELGKKQAVVGEFVRSGRMSGELISLDLDKVPNLLALECKESEI